jgi:sugar O-acyltransferase (sialic acid O-acetyltransferase NeuD family)
MLGPYPIAGIVDDGLPAGSHIMGVPVLGGSNILGRLIEQGVHLAANAVGGIGNITSRIKVFERLTEAGFSCPTLVHPTAFIEPGALLAEGVQVMPHAYVGSETQVGFGAIVNTGAIVSHDCKLGDYANLSPGAILAGEVTVGSATLVGMGVTVNLRVKIGNRARIGNGATIKQDVPENGIVRAGTVWPE